LSCVLFLLYLGLPIGSINHSACHVQAIPVPLFSPDPVPPLPSFSSKRYSWSPTELKIPGPLSDLSFEPRPLFSAPSLSEFLDFKKLSEEMRGQRCFLNFSSPSRAHVYLHWPLRPSLLQLIVGHDVFPPPHHPNRRSLSGFSGEVPSSSIHLWKTASPVLLSAA